MLPASWGWKTHYHLSKLFHVPNFGNLPFVLNEHTWAMKSQQHLTIQVLCNQGKWEADFQLLMVNFKGWLHPSVCIWSCKLKHKTGTDYIIKFIYIYMSKKHSNQRWSAMPPLCVTVNMWNWNFQVYADGDWLMQTIDKSLRRAFSDYAS